ncbi:MAG: ribosome assembly RNA-binding protein YhbY [Clostridiaceae bacterium]|nr:ribosome assembly RNA-binding protein YhbY [Clostridiaceae bacterium]
MLTGKQRAKLRAMANQIPALYQVGKNGVTDSFVSQINDALQARELIKVKVLENAMASAREICDEVCQKCGAEPVQVIGNKFVIYKESSENKKIIL